MTSNNPVLSETISLRYTLILSFHRKKGLQIFHAER
jgi:hypothetical protein